MQRATIDEEEANFEGNPSVLEALRSKGIDIPHLCSDLRLRPVGGCRLCMVEIEGLPKPQAACVTELRDGMKIRTRTPALEAHRRSVLELLAWSYPPEAVAEDPDKPFHRLLGRYGLMASVKGRGDPSRVDASHPYLRVDMSRCIECYRCVRICGEVQGQFAWATVGRGPATEIRPAGGGTLRESPCVSCGACADTCPTGAIADRTVIEHGPALAWTRTVCPYCGVGCEVEVGTREGRLVLARPVAESPVNRGHLCVKGRYAYGYNDAKDRVTTPLLRDGSGWRPATWAEAVDQVATKLAKIVNERGPGAVGVLGSARATNEENYLAQKFARTVLGTNNVDCCARVCHAPTAAAMRAVLGTGAATNSFDDLEVARAILIAGSNATENHPVVGARIRQAALRGARLIVIDPRKIELAEVAEVHLQLRPGTNVPLFNAIAHAIVTEGLEDRAFGSLRVAQREEFADFIRGWTCERAAKICRVEPGLIRKAARIYALEKPAMTFHGLGLTEHLQGTDSVACLVNLALLTGNVGKAGSGVNPLRGQNNVQGSAHMGCEPGSLTGFVPFADARERFERAWNARLPSRPGLNWMEMLDAAGDGKFQALWAIGYDVLFTNPNAEETRRALARLELLVVQDLFLNETAKELGHVFFPAASSFEKDGTFMNAERRVQRVRKALDPPTGVKTDWEVISAVAEAMGHGAGFRHRSAEEIWDEVRSLWKPGAGIGYARLEGRGLQWPCPSDDHPGTTILHQETFTHGPTASLQRIDYLPSDETPSDDFPLLLTTGRTLYHFNAGTMTLRTPNVDLWPEDLLEISKEDLVASGLADGEWVRVRSRRGSVVLRASVSSRVRQGELFATFHTPKVFLNRLTSSVRDRVTDTPEYKVTAVRVERMPDTT